jgi:hypothetical protein
MKVILLLQTLSAPFIQLDSDVKSPRTLAVSQFIGKVIDSVSWTLANFPLFHVSTATRKLWSLLETYSLALGLCAQ